jgi:hypothetical protein
MHFITLSLFNILQIIISNLNRNKIFHKKSVLFFPLLQSFQKISVACRCSMPHCTSYGPFFFLSDFRFRAVCPCVNFVNVTQLFLLTPQLHVGLCCALGYHHAREPPSAFCFRFHPKTHGRAPPTAIQSCVSLCQLCECYTVVFVHPGPTQATLSTCRKREDAPWPSAWQPMPQPSLWEPNGVWWASIHPATQQPAPAHTKHAQIQDHAFSA